MRHLREKGLDKLIRSLTQPVLAVCLGMQLLCERSDENDTACLGILPNTVRPFQNDVLKVPQIGWNNISKLRSPLFTGICDDSWVYFVHGYYVEICNETIAVSDYGIAFSAAIFDPQFLRCAISSGEIRRRRRKDHKEFSKYVNGNNSRYRHYQRKMCSADSRATLPGRQLMSHRLSKTANGLRPRDFVDCIWSIWTGKIWIGHESSDTARQSQPTLASRSISAEELRIRRAIEAAFDAGAHMVNLGSIAVRDGKKLVSWIERYGDDHILLAADVRDSKIATGGWQENTDLDVITFLRSWYERGITQTFVTDIGRDGALKGPNVELYRQISDNIPGLKLIASGGVTTIDDLIAVANAGCQGAIVGKAIYENMLSLDQLVNFQNAR